MGYWKQVKKFDLNKMGTRHNYCLANVRSSFGVKSKYSGAKEAMLASKRAGHLHSIETLPTNCAAPVFADTTSPYEHVMVMDRGTLYSDGKKVDNPNSFKYFGWSESLNDEVIVKWVSDKKSNQEIADEVIAGKWGNGEDRKKRLTEAGYNYSEVQAIVNERLKKALPIAVGDNVRPIRFVDYHGTPLRDVAKSYKVVQIFKDRAVLANGNSIYAAMKLNNLKRV